MTTIMKQRLITPAAGKRLIARALTESAGVQRRLHAGTIVVIAGTTNGYIAEEILLKIGQESGFDRSRFIRGVTLPPSVETTESGRLADESRFPGDVVIVDGVWQRGKEIFDVVNDLRKGDLIIKGANAVDLRARKAAVYIGHPKGGTILAALQAVVGRRAELLLPVGLEKRVAEDVDRIAALVNGPTSGGPRMLPVPGEIFTELDAIEALFGATATLLAAGGVGGAEGACWIGVSGEPEAVTKAVEAIAAVADEPPFNLG